MAKTTKFYGTGRRKSSIARVYIAPGTGKITINKKDMDEYFGLDTLKVIVKQPLVATGTDGKFDVMVNVKGGGFTGQLVLSDMVFQEHYLRLIQKNTDQSSRRLDTLQEILV